MVCMGKLLTCNKEMMTQGNSMAFCSINRCFSQRYSKRNCGAWWAHLNTRGWGQRMASPSQTELQHKTSKKHSEKKNQRILWRKLLFKKQQHALFTWEGQWDLLSFWVHFMYKPPFLWSTEHTSGVTREVAPRLQLHSSTILGEALALNTDTTSGLQPKLLQLLTSLYFLHSLLEQNIRDAHEARSVAPLNLAFLFSG